MGVAAVWAVGLGFLRSGAALGRAVEGLELAAVLREAGAVGAEPGRDAGRRWGAVDGVVVVPTGPLLSSAAMQSCAPVPVAGDDVETCSLWMVGALFFMPTCAII